MFFNPTAADARLIRLLGMVLIAFVMSACSTVSSIKNGTQATFDTIKTGTVKTIDNIGEQTSKTLGVISEKTNIGNNPRDPLEGFNRVMFDFNEQVDAIALKPMAQAYQSYVPGFMQAGVGNFFGNIGDVWTTVNCLLQGRGTDGVNSLMRVAVNSTFGLAGLIDVASVGGIPKQREDFGQTLGRWGVRSGPYVMLPLLGASTLRDTIAMPLDFKGDVWSYQTPVSTRNVGTVVRVVDKRAEFLNAGSLIEEAALDKYVFIRDAYLQRRASQVDPDE